MFHDKNINFAAPPIVENLQMIVESTHEQERRRSQPAPFKPATVFMRVDPFSSDMAKPQHLSTSTCPFPEKHAAHHGKDSTPFATFFF